MWVGGTLVALLQLLIVYIWNNQKQVMQERLDKLEERVDTEIGDLAETVEKGFRDVKEDVFKQYNQLAESYSRSQRELYEDMRKGREEQRQANDEFWRQIRGNKEEMSAVRLELAQKYHTKDELTQVINSAVAPLTAEIRHLRETLIHKG